MIDNYFCKLCNKNYASYASLWKHNYTFHKYLNTNKDNECDHCHKSFTHKTNKYRHMKTCKVKINKEEQLIIETKQFELEERKLNIEERKLNIEERKINILEKKEERLKETNKNNELVAPSLKTIRRLLDEKNKIINSNNTNSMVNSNNTTNVINDNSKNINYIVNFGNENICETLTMKEKQQILKSRFNCIEKIIEISNCGKYNQFKNIIITNLKDNLTYIFDNKKGNFITTDKKSSLDLLLTNRIMDIEAVYDELNAANKIDDKTKHFIENFLNEIKDEDTQFEDENEEIIYPNLKRYKINKVKILLYDNHDNMTKDLALYLN